VRAGWGREPYLRRTFYPIALDGETFLLRLMPGGDWGHAWLSAAAIGSQVDCLGPVGIGFGLAPGTRNLLCLGEEGASWSLLPLIEQAAAPPALGGRPAGMAVTLAVEGASVRDLLPASRLPATVEYHLATLDGSQGHRGRLDTLLPDWLAWADAVCAAGSLPFYERLAQAIHASRFRLERGFVQVLYQVPLFCGTGACQSCRVDLAHGRRRVCLRGPVFDLLDVRPGS
jgi:dihydroorotate dehydrogenase electron transfer subunit